MVDSFEIDDEDDVQLADLSPYSHIGNSDSVNDSDVEFNKSFGKDPDSLLSGTDIFDPFNDVRTVEYQGHFIHLETLDVKKSWKLKFQILTSYVSFLVIGLQDQTIGAIMHYLLEYYDVDRTTISYLFLFQFIGYIFTSFTNGFLHEHLGLYYLYLICVGLEMANCIAFSLKPPFWVLLVCCVFSGGALGGQDCALNTYIGSLKYSNQILGMMHGCYGLGCFISPLLCTFLIHKGMPWNHYFLLIFVISAICFVGTLLLFKNETKWKYLYKIEHEHDHDDEAKVDEEPTQPLEKVTTLTCLKNGYVQFFSLALFIYVGGELAIGSWTYNYFLTIKKTTDIKASYYTSSYWFAMTTGRMILGFVTGHYFENSEYKAITIYSGMVAFGALGFHLLKDTRTIFQIAPLCLLGLFVGPVFSTTVIIAIKTLPKRLATLGVGVICGIGAGGAAVLPYVIGWLAENLGSGNGQGLAYFPLIAFLTFFSSFGLWFGFYFVNKRRINIKLRENYTALEQSSSG